jgi:cytochrome P450/NADPH-cytochrome P450 reductase
MSLTADYLKQLTDTYEAETMHSGADVAAVLDMIPVSPLRYPAVPIAAIMKSLPPVTPRLYSYTHNPLTHQHTASLLCRLLRYRDSRPVAAGRLVSGLCSSYLCEDRQLADEVALFFRESNFHLPTDPAVPVIMICGGSGIAPFLSFLEERNRRATVEGYTLGPAVLYYGCRDVSEYMMRSELVAHLEKQDAEGREVSTPPLTNLTVAFSTNNDVASWEASQFVKHENEYIFPNLQNIPNVVIADISKLVSLMRDGAHVYVCGGQGNFGHAVRNAVNGLAELAHHSEIGHATDARDQAGLRFLVDHHRYFEDLAD